MSPIPIIRPSPLLRIAARLDVKGPNVVKGIHFEGLRVVGKPGELSAKYQEQGIDEIIFIDTVASLYGRNTILDAVREAAHGVFVPMTVGGGIRTLDDIKSVLRAGADKVAINTAATSRPAFLSEAARAFGSQCVVLSVEAKRQGGAGWEAYSDNGREPTGRNVLDWVTEAEALGVGEILLTSIDRDGTRSGFDIELLEAVRARTTVPLVACGGAGAAGHALRLLERVSVESLACASLFHYGLCRVEDVKIQLGKAGYRTRPV